MSVIREGEVFYNIKKDNGAITQIPKVEDYFAEAEDREYYLPEEDVGYAPVEGELDGLGGGDEVPEEFI